MNSLIKQPSAWVPIVLSLTVLTMMTITILTSGVPTPQPDEGTSAHLFQIWLVVEAISIGFFAIKWLPKKPKWAFLILILQVFSMLAAMFPVFYFKL